MAMALVAEGGSGSEELNLVHAVDLRPSIQELIRTQVYPETLILLIDRVHIVPISRDGRNREAYRLWLTDGEKGIQALLRHELHPFISSGKVREGSFLEIKDYHLMSAPRRTGHGVVCMLAIADLQVIGSDGRDCGQPIVEPALAAPSIKSETATSSDTNVEDIQERANQPEPKERTVVSEEANMHHGTPVVAATGYNYQGPFVTHPGTEQTVAMNVVSGTERSENRQGHHRASPETEREANAVNAVPERIETSARVSNLKRKSSEDCEPLKPSDGNLGPSLKRRKGAFNDSLSMAVSASVTTSSASPPAFHQLISIPGPPNISPLSRFNGPRTVRNKVVDVLGVICSVDHETVRRPKQPPQRNIRIMDTTTAKRVQLTVFVDAEDFMPVAGTVALFRSVTTHEWEGGSLKAYGRDCEGREWYLPDPACVEKNRLDDLRQLWKRVAHEFEDVG